MSIAPLLARLSAVDVKLRVENGELRINAPKGALTAELRDELRINKAEIIKNLRSASDVKQISSLPIEQMASQDSYPLTHAQERLWLIARIVEDTSPFNLSTFCRLAGQLNPAAVEQALDEIVSRHGSLRTTFTTIDGQPRQQVAQQLTGYFKHVDLRHLQNSDKDRELQQCIHDDVVQAFDLEQGPLLRATLFYLAKDDHVLQVSMHHIISDGWSLAVLFREFSDLYDKYSRGMESTLPALPIQYSDYTVWERNWLADDVIDGLLSYWRTQLNDLPALQLPTDHPRPPTQTYRGADVVLELSSDVSEKLEALSLAQGGTLFMALLSAFTLLLHRYCGQDDIVVGTPVANRKKAELETLIGFFVNMLVLRLNVPGDLTFRDLMEAVKKVTLDAYEHQDVPFEKLVEDLQSARDISRNPLFQVTFALQNTPFSPVNIKGVSLREIQCEIETTRFDLEAHVFHAEQGLNIRFVFNLDIFKASTVSRMLAHYARILEAVAQNPDLQLSRISLMDEQEQQRLLVELNSTDTKYPRDSNIVALFEAQVEARPNAVAVEYEGRELSYVELNAAANQLAHYLRARGVGPEIMVGLYLERSVEMVIGILGIIKAGGAYVPLDLDYPKPRIAFMLEDAQVPVLLSMSSLRHSLPAFTGELIHLDSDWPAIEQEKAGNPEIKSSAESLAYVIYTSGSTGQPKGVLVPHRAIMRLVCDTDYFQVESSDRVAQASNVSFDAATFELWGALLNGAQLVGVNREILLRPKTLSGFLNQQRITALFITTALFNLIAREEPQAFRNLRGLMFGGEAVDPATVKRILEQGSPERLLHVYGPTESTTFAAWHHVTEVPVDATTVPIGRPLANTRLYILDRNMNPVPTGIRGELYIGGDGLARGYLNRSVLTTEKFVPDPFADNPDQRLYRTGDIVRNREDGEVEFIGRIDHQVKLRGFRIELGEIEAVLSRQPGIDSSVVILREDEPDNKRLVAYGVLAEGHQANVDAIQTVLLETLPAFMVPADFVFLDELPLTSNGKLDIDALPAPEAGSHLKDSYIAPRNDVESKIAEVWKEVLRVEHVGIHDNFFNVGGNSLLLARVHEKVQEVLENKCPIIELFRYPTISTLAGYLSGEITTTDSSSVSTRDYPVKNTGQRGPIAIIGMTGRFPGAKDVETFWRNLRDGIESITFFSNEELLQAGIPESLFEQPDYIGAASSLSDVDMFDARFFGYSPRQAQVINPQQRFFLECAWEVMERAGYNPDRYPGRVGVYGGVSSNNYEHALTQDPELAKSFNDLDTFMGNDKDFLATRVSYNLNLKGPGITLQTACSTSLVATHLAIQGLHDGDCDMAIAGGCAIRNYQSMGYRYQEGGILSPDGHCRAFDAKANGTISGDGSAVVLLKHLDDALADGDQIYAVIKGSAINNDGSQKIGYTAPAVQGQAEVVADAQMQAEVDPGSISYIETHGTGTPLGDPIEIEALTQVFRKQTADKNFCAIGSLKTNVGHMDSAAGVGGLIKTTLALWHKQIPPSLHYQNPNPEIDFDNSPFFVNTELKSWNVESSPRRAGVSSFGIGGTNAHLILEEAPTIEPSSPARPWQLLVLSAKSVTALDSMTDNLHAWLRANSDVNLADLAYTLQMGRKEFNFRRVLVCEDVADAIAVFESRDTRRVFDSVVQGSDTPVVFMFTGQGSQYPEMGLQLYQYQPVYREIVDQCCDILHVHLDLDLRDVLFPSEAETAQAKTRLNQTEITQSALFVTEYALARLWMFRGINPAAMIGHSIGEYVAACLSGVISLEAALELVARRGRMMAEMPKGSMLAVPLAETELASMLLTGLEIAVVNGPQMCVVSGSDQAIDTFAAELDSKGLQTQRLLTSHAFHSAMMEPVLEPFADAVSQIDLKPPLTPYISNVTGTWITDQEATRADYYSTQLRSAVRFSDGLEQLFTERECLLLEVGPGHTLGSLAKIHPAKQDGHVIVSSLRHATETLSDETFMWQTIGRLWLAGVNLNWSSMHASVRRHRILLPTYPFERQRYWLEPQPQRIQQSLQRNDDPKQWIYVPSWRRAPLQARQTDATETSWLLFDDPHGPAARLADQLETNGADVIRVQIGNQFSRISAQQFVIDPTSQKDYEQLIQELRNTAQLPANIVHQWSSYRSCETSLDESDMASVMDHGFYSLMYLIQAIDAQEVNDAMQLAVVTSSVHQVGGNDDLQPFAATVLGLCKVIGMEHPQITCRNIDLDPVDDQSDLAGLGQVLLADLLAPSPPPVVAYRGSLRWTQIYESVQIDESINPEQLTGSPPLLKQSGVYLITGGLGGLGLLLADYLARSVKARLVLVSRSGLPERGLWQQWLDEHDEAEPVAGRINQVQALEAVGAQVLVCKADVANEEQMAEVFSSAEKHFGPISGVLHTAGASKQGTPISSITKAYCEQQLKPKIQGLMVLDRVLRDRDLDFCLVNSSLSSVMGVTEFAVYTASHIFMDTFVLQRSHNHKRATCWITINWDNWATKDVIPGQLPPGIARFLISPEEGAVVLDNVFSLINTPQVVVSTGDLQSRINQWALRRDDRDSAANKEETFSTLYERPTLEVAYEAPRDEVEQILAGIWQNMLGLRQVGIHDNFFELGGDSVLNIQITAKAGQAGLKLTPKQVFEFQTIAELAAVAKSTQGQVNKTGIAHGAVPLTPVQYWFFDQEIARPDHFNQAMLFQIPGVLNVELLQQVIDRLLIQHDALRARYSQDESGWCQRIDEIGDGTELQCFDLSELDVDQQTQSIEISAAGIQRSLDLARGPLMRLAYFDLGSSQAGRLLIAIHHLVIDAVSWRILLEDMQNAYQQLCDGGEVELPARTTSFKLWSERLGEYASNGIAASEVDYWQAQSTRQEILLPTDFSDGINDAGSTEIVNSSLSESETRQLLTAVPRIYKTRINETLLTALWRTFSRWSDSESVAVMLEGHGREAIIDDVDLSRTLGWFTSLYPVYFQFPADIEMGELIKTVKEQLRSVPSNGMGFGMLRYLADNPDIKAAMASLPVPEVSFLYLGQFDQSLNNKALLDAASESPGPLQDPEFERRQLIDISAVTSQGRLSVSWTYSRNRHKAETIQGLADDYLNELRAIIDYCSEVKQRDYTPSDFSAKGLSQSDLKKITGSLKSKKAGVV